METPEPQKLYAITVFGYKKSDMTEKDYHDYISKTHAGHLKALLAKNDIVSYTMVSKPVIFQLSALLETSLSSCV